MRDLLEEGSQSGNQLDVVQWVANAWTELQCRREDWRWMRSSFTVNTVSGTDTYAYGSCTDTLTSSAITRFGRWLPFDTDGLPVFKSYLTSSGVGTETFLGYLSWGQFRSVYKTGTQTNQQPVYFSIDPNNNLVLAPKPNGIYTITGDYQRASQSMTADADIPEMPSRFHQLIVYQAMSKYAGSLVAPEVNFRAMSEGRILMRALEKDQLPKIAIAQPLV